MTSPPSINWSGFQFGWTVVGNPPQNRTATAQFNAKIEAIASSVTASDGSTVVLDWMIDGATILSNHPLGASASFTSPSSHGSGLAFFARTSTGGFSFKYLQTLLPAGAAPWVPEYNYAKYPWPYSYHP